MLRTRARTLPLAAVCLWTCLAAAPAPPTYVNVEAVIGRVEKGWATTPDPNAAGWQALFAAVRQDLANYSAPTATEDDRLRSLNHLYQVSAALDAVAWTPAAELRNELRDWLRPRMVLAWASKRLVETVNGLPPTADANVQGNRQQWVRFVGDDLGKALQSYESATEIRPRRAALGQVYAALNALQTRNQAQPWGPSQGLQVAVDDLFNGANLQVTADPASVSKKLANYVVESGPITRNGQTAYVTAGPFMGFGLMASDDGVMFFNRQALSSVTPINGFQQQVSADQQGKRAAKLYQFNATSTDQSVLTVVAILRPSGIQLFPESTHNVQANIGSAPQPGKGLTRGIASVLGLNQYKITQKVYDGAIGQIRQQTYEGSREEAAEKSAEKAAQTNSQLANVFHGPSTLDVKNFEVDSLHLRSRPEFVLVDGLLKWRGAGEQVGAEMPRPSRFLVANPGVSADVHLGSIMTNLTRGYLQDPSTKSVTNLMVVTHKVPPGTPAKEGVVVSENVDFPTYLKAVTDSRAANDPAVQAIRVKKPGRAPEFSVERNGYLVAIVHDFALEVPAPAAAAKGGLFGPPAQIYRIEAPDAEFVISFQVAPATGDLPVRLTGRIESFDAGPGSKVIAINDDETKGSALTAFTATTVMNVFGQKLKGQPIDAPLGDLKIPGFTLTSVSPIDPTGWMRVVLTPQAQ